MALADTAVATWVNIDTLKYWDGNYNHGNIGAVMSSIEAFGFLNAPRLWQDNIVMAGNHALNSVRQLVKGGWEPYGGAIRVNGDAIELLTVDMSYLTYEQAKAFAVADNRTASLAEPDEYALVELLQEFANSEDDSLLNASGYDGDDLDAMLSDLGFSPVSISEQPSLDLLTPLICPHCGKDTRIDNS